MKYINKKLGKKIELDKSFEKDQTKSPKSR